MPSNQWEAETLKRLQDTGAASFDAVYVDDDGTKRVISFSARELVEWLSATRELVTACPDDPDDEHPDYCPCDECEQERQTEIDQLYAESFRDIR